MGVRWVSLSWLVAVAFAHVPPARADEPPRREGFEEAPEFGGSLYVMEVGPEDGAPLVLIHGLGTNGARDFDPILLELARRFRVLAFDLPGLARSSHRDDNYAPGRYAALVSGLVTRHFGARPVSVLGHSMGGAIAIQFAGDHPELVERLLLFNVAGILHYREYLRAVIAGSPQTTWERTLAGARKVLFNIGMFPARRMRLEDLALDASPTLRSFFSSGRTAALLFIQHDFGPAIRRVRAPTFIGWGALDNVAPLRTAMILRSQLPLRGYREFAGSGHVPMRSEPAAVAEAVHAFMDTPLGVDAESARPRTVGRVGVCERRRDRVFEGEFDKIVIHRCKNVTLRHVRARELVVDRSEVELADVSLESSSTAVSLRRSRVHWSGGAIRADVCIVTDGSTINLGGVQCSFRSESIRVLQPTRIIASASVLEGAQQTRLHGEYQLFRTQEGALPELRPLAEGHYTKNSRSSLREQELAGEWLVNEDMTGAALLAADLSEARLDGAVLEGADLRGATLSGARLNRARLRGANLRGAKMRECDLREADLRGADLRDTNLDATRLEGARFDDSTKFPPGFSPYTCAMRLEPQVSPREVAP